MRKEWGTGSRKPAARVEAGETRPHDRHAMLFLRLLLHLRLRHFGSSRQRLVLASMVRLRAACRTRGRAALIGSAPVMGGAADQADQEYFAAIRDKNRGREAPRVRCVHDRERPIDASAPFMINPTRRPCPTPGRESTI